MFLNTTNVYLEKKVMIIRVQLIKTVYRGLNIDSKKIEHHI